MQTHQDLQGFLAVLDALALPRGSWAATDADGTLWAADLADEAWRRVLAEGRLRPESAEALAALVAEAGAKASGDPHTDARALYDLYLADVIGDPPLVVAMTVCYAGWSEAEVRAFAAEVARERIAPRAYGTTLALLGALRARDIRLSVISGSPRLLVEEALRAIGLADPLPAVLGTDLERDGDGRLLGRMRQPITWEAGKVEAMGALLGPEPLAIAFGDTVGDLALLEAAARLRVLVHPRPNLREACRRWTPADGCSWCELAPTHVVSGEAVVPPTGDKAILG